MEDKLNRYRRLIRSILGRKAALENGLRRESAGKIRETVAAFDDENDVYLLQRIGWNESQRIWATPLFIRIVNGKFWIEEDWTEEGVATDLMEAGVPKDEIVLAFHHPEMRPFSEFAVA